MTLVNFMCQGDRRSGGARVSLRFKDYVALQVLYMGVSLTQVHNSFVPSVHHKKILNVHRRCSFTRCLHVTIGQNKIARAQFRRVKDRRFS